MPARKKKSLKAQRRNAPKICTDANQRIIESLKEKKRQRDAIIKKIAELKAKEALAQEQRGAVSNDEDSMGTVSALGEEGAES